MYRQLRIQVTRLSQGSLSIYVPVFYQRGRTHYSLSKALCPCDTSVINLVRVVQMYITWFQIPVVVMTVIWHHVYVKAGECRILLCPVKLQTVLYASSCCVNLVCCLVYVLIIVKSIENSRRRRIHYGDPIKGGIPQYQLQCWQIVFIILPCFPGGGGGISGTNFTNLVQMRRWASSYPPYKCILEYGKSIPINVYTIIRDNNKYSLFPLRLGSFMQTITSVKYWL